MENEFEKIYNIRSKALFQLYKGTIDKEEYTQIINSIPNIDTKLDYIDNLISNRIFLSDYYRKVINLYKNYITKEYIEYYEKEDIEKLFYDFLKYLNCKNLYDRVKEKDMIVFPKELATGGFTLYYGNLSYILVKDRPDKIALYDSLAHEIGHTLSNNTLYNIKGYDRQITIKSEIISILLEKLFLYYLLTNSKIDKETIKKYIIKLEKKYFDITKNAKKSLDLLDNPNIIYSFNGSKLIYTHNGEENTISMYDNIYAIGNIITAKILNENDYDYYKKNLKNLILEIDNLSMEQLINEYFDLEAIKKHLNKQLIRKK